jgi:hypothetical protein
MSMTSWLEIYRAYSGDELNEEMASLRKSLAGGFISQSSGSVQHQKDVTELWDRLQAATRVYNTRRGAPSAGMQVGKIDFSGVSSSDF